MILNVSAVWRIYSRASRDRHSARWFVALVWLAALSNGPKWAFGAQRSIPGGERQAHAMSGSAQRQSTSDDNDIWRIQKRCGVNSAYVFARLLGQPVDYDDALDGIPISDHGTSMADMKEYLSRRGIKSEIIKTSPQYFTTCSLPAVALLEAGGRFDRHFSVVVDASPSRMCLIDGTTGELMPLTLPEFSERWTGYLLVARGGPDWLHWASMLAILGGGLTIARVFALRRRRKNVAPFRDTLGGARVDSHAVQSPADRGECPGAAIENVVRIMFAASLCVLTVSHPLRLDASELKVIADAYRAQSRSLQSLYVEYRIKSEPLGPLKEIRRQLFTLYFEDEEKVFAFKGPKRYSKLTCATQGVHADFLLKDTRGQPKRILTTSDAEYAFDGERLYYINGTMGSDRGLAAIVPIDRNSDSDASYFDQEYMRWAVRTLPDVLNVDKDRANYSLLGLIDANKCRLLAQSTEVDGARCAIVEWRAQGKLWNEDETWGIEWWRHSLWCDALLGYAPRRYEVRLESSGSLASLYGFSDFVEVTNGVWFPRIGYWDRYALGHIPSQVRNVPLLRYSFQVGEIHANDVKDNLFALSFAPGALVRDERYLKNGTPIYYSMPADASDLDAAIELALAGHGIGESVPSRRLWLRLSIGLLALIFVCLVTTKAYRALRRA